MILCVISFMMGIKDNDKSNPIILVFTILNVGKKNKNSITYLGITSHCLVYLLNFYNKNCKHLCRHIIRNFIYKMND